ncbi:hypothetical protein [Streptomyces siamensis]|uniref:Tc1-like transposase DDE domain-containing protein n=1 Tax=Streptomyces siamensis TaxID=1274986 RepID=A0ABP9JDM5_9ACTN
MSSFEAADPVGDIYVVTDNLSSRNGLSTRTWLEDHPRIRPMFIPFGACRLNLQEGWWRIFRKAALAGRPRGVFKRSSICTYSAVKRVSKSVATTRCWTLSLRS